MHLSYFSGVPERYALRFVYTEEVQWNFHLVHVHINAPFQMF